MYVYQITNKVNGKQYIGITNNPKKRWENHKCNNDPSMVIAKAIQKYGKDNFDFEVLYSNLSVEEASEKEIQLIKEKHTRVPDGYNVADGGMYNPSRPDSRGALNSHAKLSYEEAKYIKDHRNLPLYVLYEQYADKITYGAFKNIYNHRTYTNIPCTVDPYPYNSEFSEQFILGKLEYDEVVRLRNMYNDGAFWKTAYEEFKDRYPNQWTFWNIYNGKQYALVMPEVFTPENKKKHASLARTGERNGRAKLTSEDVITIRKLHADGATNQQLYELYPQVTHTSIRAVINNETWKNLL